MPFLSKVLINPLRSDGRRFLSSPQAIHAAVLGGIVSQPVTERVLWRLDAVPGPGSGFVQGELLVLSESHPSLHHIVEQAGYWGAGGSEPVVRDYRALLGLIATGREFAFKVRVNPVQATRNPDAPTVAQRNKVMESEGRRRGFRLAHRTIDQQIGWLLGRSDRSWGFVVPEGMAGEPDLRVVGRERLSFSKRTGNGVARRVQVQTATFEGRLRVSDVSRFTAALLGGIGPAKAYGCGLITLAPIASNDG
jgi:CRISPR system Cascade subunit CasE